MDYYDGLIRDTEFFTTSELAKKLKMNAQVITRKVQAGEIYAFKIGKDWRIPEQAVYEWLQKHANSPRNSASPIKSKTTKPVKRSVDKSPVTVDRKFRLQYILAQFEPNRTYSQEEVDRIIGRYDANYDAIRQEFISVNMMDHTDGYYRRRGGYQFTD